MVKKKFVLPLKTRIKNREYFKEYYKKNKDKVLKKNKAYNESQKAKLKKETYNKSEKGKKIRTIWIKKNLDKVRAKNRKSYHKNKIKNLEYSKKYYESIKSDPDKNEKFRKRVNLNNKKKRKNNPHYKVKQNLSRRLRTILTEIKKPKNIEILKLIGCSLEDLKKYIEKKFKKGMNWQNYGKWHVDHIIPCSKFDLTNLAQQRKCFNFKNLQPLWAKENILKSDR